MLPVQITRFEKGGEEGFLGGFYVGLFGANWRSRFRMTRRAKTAALIAEHQGQADDKTLSVRLLCHGVTAFRDEDDQGRVEEIDTP